MFRFLKTDEPYFKLARAAAPLLSDEALAEALSSLRHTLNLLGVLQTRRSAWVVRMEGWTRFSIVENGHPDDSRSKHDRIEVDALATRGFLAPIAPRQCLIYGYGDAIEAYAITPRGDELFTWDWTTLCEEFPALRDARRAAKALKEARNAAMEDVSIRDVKAKIDEFGLRAVVILGQLDREEVARLPAALAQLVPEARNFLTVLAHAEVANALGSAPCRTPTRLGAFLNGPNAGTA